MFLDSVVFLGLQEFQATQEFLAILVFLVFRVCLVILATLACLDIQDFQVARATLDQVYLDTAAIQDTADSLVRQALLVTLVVRVTRAYLAILVGLVSRAIRAFQATLALVFQASAATLDWACLATLVSLVIQASVVTLDFQVLRVDQATLVFLEFLDSLVLEFQATLVDQVSQAFLGIRA